MRFLTLFISMMLFVTLSADDAEDIRAHFPASALANTEGLINSIIDGKVSAITGDYIEYQADLVIDGPEPLILGRYYSGSHCEYLGISWDLTIPLPARVRSKSIRVGTSFKDGYLMCVREANGGALTYGGVTKTYKANKLTVLSPYTSKGFTNCGSGRPSGKSNPLNNVIHYSKDFTVTNGAGDVRYYNKNGHENFHITSEWKANGCHFDYSYRKNQLIKVTASDVTKTIQYASLDFKDPDNGLLIEGSNGENVKYIFNKYNVGNDTKASYLTSVHPSHGPNSFYKYTKQRNHHHLISEKTIGETASSANKLNIEYYDMGDNPLDNHPSIRIKNKLDARIDRIRRLRNSYGTTFEFVYDVINDDTICQATDVYNAEGYRTRYSYNISDQRLFTIENFTGKGKDIFPLPILKQKFDWSDQGLLLSKSDTDVYGNLLKKTTFGYDEKFNITVEVLEGDLTGNGEKTAYGRWFKYSNDGYNNLIAEGDEDSPTIEYCYLPYTDLLTGRYVICDNVITVREFKFYDECRLCTEEFYDNGSAREYYDLEDVTERLHVKRQVSHEPHLLGKTLVESFYYFENGQEKLLKTTNYTYDKKGRPIRQELYDGQGIFCYAIEKRYDEQGNVVWENDPFGNTINRTFDIYGNILTECGPDKRYILQTTYDDICRPFRQDRVESNGMVFTSFKNYNQLNQVTSQTDELGRETHFLYDFLGRCIEELRPLTISGVDDEIPTLNASWYENDPLGNLVTIRSNDGGTIHQKYTTRGQLSHKTYPDGSYEKWTYSPSGRLLDHKNRQSITTLYTYDKLGNRIKEEILGNDNQFMGVTTFTWKGKRLIQITDPLGYVKSFKYDGAGRLIEEQQAGTITQYSYDSLGRRCQESTFKKGEDRPLLHRFTKYDFADRVIEETCSTGDGVLLKKSQNTYDVLGNKTSTICWSSDQVSATIHTEYNSFGKVIKVVDPAGLVTHIAYNLEKDPHNHSLIWIKTTIDPTSRQTTEKFDPLDRLKEEIVRDESGILLSKQIFTYDLGGRRSKCVLSVIEEGMEVEQQLFLWNYNTCGDLIEEISAWRTPEERTITHTYQASVKTYTNKADGNCISYTYDSKSRLQNVSDTYGTLSYTYTYDILDRIVTVQDNITKNCIQKAYDENDQLVQEIINQDLSLKFEYDPLDQLTRIIYPDGSTANYIYEGIYLKSMIRQTFNGEERYRYTVDQRNLFGNPLKVTLPGQAGELVKSFDQEGRSLEIHSPYFHQILQERDKEYKPLKIHNRTPNNSWTDCFTYDKNGNLSSEDSFVYLYDSIGNRVYENNQRWMHNRQNQLLKTHEVEYVYDANGNLTSDGTHCYKYDAFNRLIQVQTPTSTIKYIYDDLHRRLQKNTDNSMERYAFVGDDEIGTYTTNGFECLRILADGLGAEIGATVAIECKDNYFVPIHDHRGSIHSLIDGITGQEELHFSYSAFGKLLIGNHQLCPWGFSGKRYDQETGFTYFGQRYYSPQLGRWTTLDPEGFDENPNGYSYVNNRPHCQIDLYGRLSDFISAPSFMFQIYRQPARSEVPRQSMNYRMIAGMAHGAANFAVNAFHGFHTGLAYLGSESFEMSIYERVQMFKEIHQSQLRQSESIDNAIMNTFSIDKSDAIYQTFRSMTTTGLEIASIAEGGYGLGKGLLGLRRMATRAPMQASRLINAESSIVARGGMQARIRCAKSPIGQMGWELKNASSQPRNLPTTIYGRQYSGHALDQMQNRGIMPSVIENTIENSVRIIGKNKRTFAHYDFINNVSVITSSQSGGVVTASYGKIRQ